MKQKIALAVVLVGVGICTAMDKPIPEVVITENGKSDYVIVVPDGQDGNNRVKKASDLLQSMLAEATGVKLPVIKESELKAGTPAIYLGQTQAAAKAVLPLKQLKGWTFIKQVKGKDVFLAGIDDTVGIKSEGFVREYLGTLKAVTSFLENEVGVRFLLPGPNGRFVPKVSRLAIKTDLKMLKATVFTYIIGRNPGDMVYKIANNYLDIGTLKSYSGHSYYWAVPKEKYAKDHPEYFALLGGVRSPDANHLCISNPDVQELMIQLMKQDMDNGYEAVDLGQTDGYSPCECDKCKAIHPDIAERLWIVHRKLAERMKKERPGKQVAIMSYSLTAGPPVSFKTFPDNIVIMLCSYSPESFDQWNQFNVAKTVAVYNWGTYMVMGVGGPKRDPRYAAEQVQRFVENKVQGIYTCGAFELWGLEGPVYYVFGKMLGDPSLKYMDVVNDYYQAAYGKARAPMKAFFTAMYDRLELNSAVGSFARPNFHTEMKNIPVLNTPEDWYCYFFPAKLLADMEKNLERAKALADDPAVQARIRLVELEFGYVKNLASIFQCYRAYRLKPNWDYFNLMAEEIERRNAMIDSWYDEKGNFRLFDGWPMLFGAVKKDVLKVNGAMLGILSAPVNWNTTLLKEKKILPGVGVKTANVKKVAGLKISGKMDDPAWKEIPTEELGELGMGELKNGTTFKMAYDDQNFYFGFECAFDNTELIEIKPFGHDGKCWQAQCLEIFLDPFGSREKYYHFIFNPVANSYYEARRGFIDDPTHPLVNKEDPSWNGAWEYMTAIDGTNKKWTAEVKIPFKTLEAETPRSGTIWTMNLGREDYTVAEKLRGATGLIVSLWSPNLEERNFCSASAFGKLIFE